MLDEQEGCALALAALRHLDDESSKGSRVALVPNLAGGAGILSRALLAASRLQSRRAKIGPFMMELLEQHAGEICVKEYHSLELSLSIVLYGMVLQFDAQSQLLTVFSEINSLSNLQPACSNFMGLAKCEI